MRIPPLIPNITYHIYNRGVSAKKIFKDADDYKNFMGKINKYRTKFNIDLVTFCLLPNHYHMLIKIKKNTKNVSNFFKCLQQSYALHFNNKYHHSGHLFQGAYKNKMINSEQYYVEAIQYIYYNPVKHKIVDNPEKWPYRQ